MNYNIYLNYLAQQFQTQITGNPTTQPIPTEDFGWENYRYHSQWFRLAHVERYSDSKIEVLHVTTFPHQWSPEPIFGFDVICTDNQIVGAYMDLSPTIKTYPFDEGVTFRERKPLPSWATVFSDRFILLKPVDDIEFLRFCEWTLDTYTWYLTILQHGDIAEWDDEAYIISRQNKYCRTQSSNPRTYNVLKAKIGAERAQYFMEQVLFPTIS